MGNSVERFASRSHADRHTAVTPRGAPSSNGVQHSACLALVVGWEDRARLRTALGAGVDVAFVASLADVLPALRGEHQPLRAVILEARDAGGRPTAGLARQVTRLFPSVPVIGYCSAGAEHSQDILSLAAAGVHELLFKHVDDRPGMLRGVLQSADQACAADMVLSCLGDRLPSCLQPLVEHCLTNPEASHSVEEVARSLGVHRKTLVNHCTAGSFPPPGAVLAWCLLLLTTAMLASPGVTVERVALQLNFPSATALRNMLKRYTGLRPRDLRGEHILETLCSRFVEHRASEEIAAHVLHA